MVNHIILIVLIVETFLKMCMVCTFVLVTHIIIDVLMVEMLDFYTGTTFFSCLLTFNIFDI